MADRYAPGEEDLGIRLDTTTVEEALDLTYDKAVDGIPGVPGWEPAQGLAEDYLDDSESLEGW